MLGVIGANGSGKTTLLKILSQATAPTSGRVVQYGKQIPIIDIGSGFHPDLSGRENIFLYGTVMLGMKKSEIQENLKSIIDFSELGNFIDEPLKNYSNGMYLRLALSVALFCKLDILLLDEVFSVGDSAFMLKSYDKMSHIIAQSASVVFASHDMNDIIRLCSTCMWLEKGQIKMTGNTNEVVASYMASNEHLLQNRLGLESLALHGKAEWNTTDAPTTEHFCIKTISVRNAGGSHPQTELDYDFPIVFDIEYEKKIATCEIGFSLILTDHYGTALLTSPQYLDIKNENKFLGKTGTFRSTCVIPGQLLNLGIYKINVRILLNHFDIVMYLTSVLTFRIISKNDRQSDILKMTPMKFVPAFQWEFSELGGIN